MAKLKITFEQLINNHKFYIEFGSRQDLPIQVAFKYSKILKQINEEVIDIEKQRANIISKYELDKAENHANKDINAKADEEWNKFIKSNFFKFDFEPISIKSYGEKLKNISPAMLNAMSEFFTD